MHGGSNEPYHCPTLNPCAELTAAGPWHMLRASNRKLAISAMCAECSLVRAPAGFSHWSQAFVLSVKDSNNVANVCIHR